jgi:hypothetical protein
MIRTSTGFLAIMLLMPLGAASNPLPLGVIGLYGDPAAGTRCVSETPAGELYFYVVHDRTAPFLDATYLHFSAPKPTCLQAVHLADQQGPGALFISGDSQTGVEIMLIGCVPSPGAGHVMTIVYSVTGETPTDCWYPPQPDGFGRLEAVGCDLAPYDIAVSGALVNPSRPCLCVVGTEETTWGKVKALYSD